ncbi:unnamed protein product [Caenorhabditis sp. 36 PRJEB53466]|nr:unnamed protein product [Caenorhabditis sp. 36 PRJEB53466]
MNSSGAARIEHFLALCCYGGEPFVDFHTNESIDPTDWSADLVKDVNETIGSNLTQSIESIGVDLAQCQMFNITFTNLADQFLFDTYKANFLCRCPIGRTGQSCELEQPIALALSQDDSFSPPPPNPMVMLLVIAAVVLALMVVLAMMVKGCFCDCFGPFAREDPYDKPLDPEDVRRCLQKVRENQAAREMALEPLVSHPPPPAMVSESYSAPFAQGPPPPPPPQQQPAGYPSAPPMPYRPPSPPPAYTDIDRNPAVLHNRTQI